MLDLNINKNRTLNFEIQLGGINPDQLDGSLTFIIDNVQYGIPIKIREKEISVNIPPLTNVTQKTFTEGEEIQAKLEVHGNGNYLNPWNGSFIVKSPIVMEATITEIDEEIDTPEINVKSLSDGTKQEKIEIVKDKSRETDEETKNKPDENIGKVVKNKVNEKMNMISRLVDEAILGKNIRKTKTIPKKKVREGVKKVERKEITEDLIKKYIKVFGSKNEQIQEIIFEQAKVATAEMGEGNNMESLFKKVQEILPRGRTKK